MPEERLMAVRKRLDKLSWSKRDRLAILPVLILSLLLPLGVSRYQASQQVPAFHYELSEELRLSFTNVDAVIEQIRHALAAHSSAIRIHYKASDGYMDEVSTLVSELMACAMMDAETPTEGDYIRYQYGGYDLSYGHMEDGDSYRYDLVITPVYYTDIEQEAYVDERVQEILDGFGFTEKAALQGASADASEGDSEGSTAGSAAGGRDSVGSAVTDEEKIAAVYDYICSHVSYDSIHKTSLYHLKSTAYGALYSGIAGCQGYSVLAYRLLQELGIDCRVVTGMAEYEGESEYHAWNIVRLGDCYYNMDITWDARLGEPVYYLRGESFFTDHSPDEEFLTEAFLQAYPISRTDYSN